MSAPMSALTVSRALAIPVMVGYGMPMDAAVSTLRSAEKYGRASVMNGSLTVYYARGRYTLS